MANYRYFRVKFWSDPYIISLSQQEKLLYVYLFTNEHTNQAGIYSIACQTISFETNLLKEVVEKGLSKFETDEKIKIDKERSVLWIINFLKHQPNKNPKVLIRIAEDLKEIGKSSLIPKFLEVYHTLSIPYQYPINRESIIIKEKKNKNNNKIKNERSKDKELFVGNQNHFRLTNLLKDLILQNDPKAKVPENITKWVDSIEKLERIDKRTAEEIEAVIRFSQEDDFWKANILSTKKLRKQFSQLMLKAKQNFGGLSGKNRRSLTAIMNADYGEGKNE